MRGTLAALSIVTFMGIALSLAPLMTTPFAVDAIPEAEKAIRDANANLINAFTAVVTAEKSGADVTALTTDLNKALRLLNDSRAYYETENYPLAITCADDSSEISEGISISARELGERAAQEAMVSSISTIVSAIFVIVVLYFIGTLGWKWWKQRSYKKLMEMRVKEVGVTKGG